MSSSLGQVLFVNLIVHYVHIYIFFVVLFICLASGGSSTSTPRFYSITQWSCSAPGLLWEMPDSNPGPLPQKSLARCQWPTTSPEEMSIYYLKGNVYYHWTVTLWSLKVRDFMKMRAESVFFRKISFNPKRYDIVLFSATFIKTVVLWRFFEYKNIF